MLASISRYAVPVGSVDGDECRAVAIFYIGYTVSDSQTGNDGLVTSRSFTGDGGLHQMYAGIGVKVLKNLSIGVNASYFWGDLTRGRAVYYPGASSSYSYRRTMVASISDYKLDFGAQYTQVLNKKSSLTVGAVYSPKHKLNNDYSSTVLMAEQTSNQASYQDNLDATFEYPIHLESDLHIL